MNTIYFQPKGMNPKYCEIGIMMEGDEDHMFYLEEPYSILISEVNIIDKDNVTYDEKTGLYNVKQ